MKIAQPRNLSLFNCWGVVKTYGFFNDSSHATHYLKFSVKIITNQLHHHYGLQNIHSYIHSKV